jgi:ketosteroid isomerase-like protein
VDIEALVHALVDAYNSRQLDAHVELLFDPDVELVPLRALVEDTVYRGHECIRQLAHDIEESWSEAEIEVHELEIRGEQAASTGRLRLTGRSSRRGHGGDRGRIVVGAQWATGQIGVSPNS